MLETLKKKSFKKVIAWVVVLYIAAVACMIISGCGIFKLPFKKDIYDLDVNDLEGLRNPIPDQKLQAKNILFRSAKMNIWDCTFLPGA